MRLLIVYYSRTGVTKKTCHAIAEAVKAAETGTEVTVEEIVDRVDRSGALGYARGGKDAMLKKSTEIDPIAADVAAFDLVVIGTPVWAFTCAPALRTFCEQFAGQMQAVAFVATMGGSGDKGAFEAMEGLCGRAPVATLTLRERFVKSDDAEQYLQPVGAFAGELLAQGDVG